MALDIYYTQDRHTGRLIFSIILIALLAATGWYGFRWYTTGEIPFSLPIASANTAVSESAITPAQISGYSVPTNNPRYIRIPTLNIDNTRVFPVGLDASNQVETTPNINDTAWYKKSATPGSGGVVLIAGHSVGVGHDGAFIQLKTLQTGAQIVIERGDGKVLTYKVVENQSMTIAEVNATGMKKMGQPVVDGVEGLNLITTDGKWVPRLGTFDRRILVRATIID